MNLPTGLGEYTTAGLEAKQKPSRDEPSEGAVPIIVSPPTGLGEYETSELEAEIKYRREHEADRNE